MKLALLVYLAGMVDDIRVLLFILSFLIFIGAYFLGAALFIYKNKNYKKPFIITSISTILICLFAIIIPSERTVYIMAGAYATEQIATNDRVQKIGSDVLEVIEGKLEKLKEDK